MPFKKPVLNENALKVLAAIPKTSTTSINKICEKTKYGKAVVRHNLKKLFEAKKVNIDGPKISLVQAPSAKKVAPPPPKQYTPAVVKAKLDLEVITATREHEPALFVERCLMLLYNNVADRKVFGKEVRIYVDVLDTGSHLSEGQMSAAYFYVVQNLEPLAKLLNMEKEIGTVKTVEKEFDVYYRESGDIKQRVKTVSAFNQMLAIAQVKRNAAKGFHLERVTCTG